MTINFTERKTNVSDGVKDYAQKKCAKLDKYFGNESSVQITFSCEREMETAEITLENRGMFFRAQERTTDMYASIDGAVASIDKQIQKNKTKILKRIRHDAFESALHEMTDFKDEEFEVVREKQLVIKPMTTEDAILQMNLLGHNFFFFENSERSGNYCVVYKRNDGGYGLLIAGK